MKTLKITLALVLTGTLGACASMRDFIYNQAGDSEAQRQPAAEEAEANYGIEIRKENYYQAMARWPWADSSQLHRRALILSLGPTDEMLNRLDTERDEDIEIRILTDLASRNPKRWGMSARNN